MRVAAPRTSQLSARCPGLGRPSGGGSDVGGAEVVVDRPAAGVVRIRIANPPVNALSMAVMRGMREAMDAAVADATRVAVITGGEGRFSAGGDLKATNPLRETLEELGAMLAAVRRAPFPVIAAVDGACLGGGFELALQCDLRLASERALFACSGVRVGWLSPHARLVELVGAARAAEMLLVGRRYEARELEAVGLLRVTADGALEDEALALAVEIAGLAPRSVATTKRALRAGPGRSLAETDAEFIEQALDLAMSEDHAEARLALTERRQPRFVGA